MVIWGYYCKLLSSSGAVSAFVIGLLIVLGLGVKGLIIMGLFFVAPVYGRKWKVVTRESQKNYL